MAARKSSIRWRLSLTGHSVGVSGHHRRLDGQRWAAARRVALEAAGWRCERCGAAGALEAHHKKPLHLGGEPYQLDNLIVLCRSCHIDAHRRPLTDAERAWRELVEELL